MAESNVRTRCPECDQLRTRIGELEAQLAAARKHSRNSSKPPSSDLVKPPKDLPRGKNKKRRRGGQKGHPRHERPLFPAEQITKTHDHILDSCPDCGGALSDVEEETRVVQQVELVEKPWRVDEHRGHAYWCSPCRKLHYAAIPKEVRKAGLAGPQLTALVAYLKGVCHNSFSTIRKLFRDVLKITISRGQLAKLVRKVSDSLKETYEELLAALPSAAQLNVDETGHPDQGQHLWTWCFRAPLFTLFHIDASRGSDVLIDVLGQEFNGLLGCDYFSAYRKYMKNCGVQVQFCLAHLIRDVKFLVEHPDQDNRRYGEMLLDHLRKLFGVIHRRDSFATPKFFQYSLERIRDQLVHDAFEQLVDTREAVNLAKRFFEHAESYFRFITEPDIEPTNNLAEQAIRFVAIHRRMTQGTRGDTGQRWCERIWTVAASCLQQGRSVFHFLCAALQAHFQGQPSPSLLPDTT